MFYRLAYSALALFALIVPAVALGGGQFFVVSPKHDGFGKIPVGIGSATQTFTFANKGLDTVAAGSSTTSDPTEFIIQSDGCVGQFLLPDHSCQVTVYFQPATAGAKTATLSNTGTNTTTLVMETPTVKLAGTGI